ncbi:MAG: glycosyltransferase family 39 protein [Nanoarchaeota archaeon]|nr:MAG: glycosyltransferase family 39 protein [Nanoarchaeota archaeon]
MKKQDSQFGKWLFILTLSFVIVRLPSFWLGLAEDEQVWTLSSMVPNGFQYAVIEHPPLTTFLYSLVGFSGNWRLLHIIPLIFSVGIFIFAVLLARKYYGKTAAIWTAAIMTVSTWAILAAAQVDMDGSVVPFWGIASLYFFLEGLEKKSVKNYVLSGIFLGIGFWAKTSLILFLGSFFLYTLWLIFIEKKAYRQFISSGLVYLISLGIYALFPLYSFITHDPLYAITQQHASEYFNNFFSQNLLSVFSIMVQAIVLMSPLLLFLFLYSLIKPGKKDVIFFIVPIVYVFFYLFIATPSFRPFERYWMPAIPFMAILGGKTISNWNLKKPDYIKIIAGSVVILAIFTLLSLFLRPELFPVHPKELYISKVLSLQWNFLFPFHGASGPLGFFIPFWAIPVAFVVCAFCLFMIWKNKLFKPAAIIFLSVAIGINLFMDSEFLLSTTTPNINSVQSQVTSYALSHDLKKPIYIYEGTAHYFLNHTDVSVTEFNAVDRDNKPLFDEIKNGGTVLVVDFPSATRDSAMWQTLMTCKTDYKVIEKGHDIGYVFTC